jgi:hypothetical protein
MDVYEIVKKECEKHLSLKIGLISDENEAANRVQRLLQLNPEAKEWSKAEFLRHFYRSAGYPEFINREKSTNKTLKKHLTGKANTFLEMKRKKSPALLDTELKTTTDLSLAYHFSLILYNAIYDAFCLTTEMFNTPDETEAFFFRQLDKKYPLYIKEYVDLLGADDSSMWNRTCLYIQKISSYVVALMLNNRDQGRSYHDIVADETWEKAYEVMRSRLVSREGRVPTFQGGADFRNYVIKTCRFIAENLSRKYAGKESFLDDVFPYSNAVDENDEAVAEMNFDVEADQGTEESAMKDVMELDIDVNNPYEVAYAVSIIILNKKHILHSELTSGLEQKVNILVNKVVEGMSYERIVDLIHNGSLDSESRTKAIARARKDAERVRKTLIERMIKILEARKNRHTAVTKVETDK